MRRQFYYILAFAILLLTGAALYCTGSYVAYILSYVFSFAFLFCYTVFSESGISDKILQSLIYALILAAQILLDVLVIRVLLEESQDTCSLGKLLGVSLIFIPFIIRLLFASRKN